MSEYGNLSIGGRLGALAVPIHQLHVQRMLMTACQSQSLSMTLVLAIGLPTLVVASPVDSFQAAAPATVTFRVGDAGYTGQTDSFIGLPVNASHTGANMSTRVDLWASGYAPTSAYRYMIRFGDIVGPGPGQIPAAPMPIPANPQAGDLIGINIDSATLSLRTHFDDTASPGVHSIYQLTIPYDHTDSYDDLGDGVGDDGVGGITLGTETLAAPTSTTTASGVVGDFSDFDITSAVQNWVNGDPNYGLYFDTLTDTRSRFTAVDSANLLERPLLTVTFSEIFYTPPPLTPEPGSLLLWGGIGAAALAVAWKRHRRRAADELA